MTAYGTAGPWLRYAPCFLPEMRYRGLSVREETWRWRDRAVHVDRFTRPDAPLTLVVLHRICGYSSGLFVVSEWPAGYVVVVPDLPGYGLTLGGSRRCLTPRPSFSKP